MRPFLQQAYMGCAEGRDKPGKEMCSSPSRKLRIKIMPLTFKQHQNTSYNGSELAAVRRTNATVPSPRGTPETRSCSRCVFLNGSVQMTHCYHSGSTKAGWESRFNHRLLFLSNRTSPYTHRHGPK